MKRGISYGLIAAAIAVGGALGCSPGAASPSNNVVRIPLEIRTLTLRNGMRVILDEDHR